MILTLIDSITMNAERACLSINLCMCIIFNITIFKSINGIPTVDKDCWPSFLEIDDGSLISNCRSSSLLATGPFDSHLCGQWPTYVRDAGVPILCVWSVSACDLAHHRTERDRRQARGMEASGFVLVCRLWFHPLRHRGMVLTVLWYYSRRPELPVTAVWVQTKNAC